MCGLLLYIIMEKKKQINLDECKYVKKKKKKNTTSTFYNLYDDDDDAYNAYWDRFGLCY